MNIVMFWNVFCVMERCKVESVNNNQEAQGL